MKEFLESTESFEQRHQSIHSKFALADFVDNYWLQRFEQNLRDDPENGQESQAGH